MSGVLGASLLAEFEGRHPEAALEPHSGRAILVHARRLEDGRHRVARRERDSGRVGFGRVKKDGRAGRASDEPREQTIGGLLVVGEQRPDLESFPARPKNAVALQPALIDDAERDSLRLAIQDLRNASRGRRESGLVVAQDLLDRDRRKVGRDRRGAAPPPPPL